MRIVSLISAGTEMLFALGLGPQVVGVSHECDWPPEAGKLPQVTRTNIDDSAASEVIDLQVRRLMASGKPLYEVDRAALAALKPDLIVAQSQCKVCAVGDDDVRIAVQGVPKLRSTPIVSLEAQSLGEVFADIARLAVAADAADRGKTLVANLRERLDRVRQHVAERRWRPRVAMIEWTAPLMLAGNWVPELVAIAGGDCPLTTPGERSRCHPWSELRAFDPQVIVVCPCGFDVARTRQEAATLCERAGWHDLAAVRSGRVYAVDGNRYFNRPGPRLVDSIELLTTIASANAEPGDAPRFSADDFAAL